MQLLVRRMEWEDLERRVAWFNEPSVFEHMVIDIPLSLARTKEWFHKRVADPHNLDFVFDLANGGSDTRRCAMGGLTDISERHSRAELYVVVKPGMYGQGIGTAAVMWLCNYGFLEVGLRRIYVQTVDNNDGARRLYKRLGFIHEGVLREHIRHHGRFVDRHVQALLQTDWATQPWREEKQVQLRVDVRRGSG